MSSDFLRSLSRALRSSVCVSAAKPTANGCVFCPGYAREDVRRGIELQLERAAALLELLRRRIRHLIVRHGGRGDEDVRTCELLVHDLEHGARAFDIDALDPAAA